MQQTNSDRRIDNRLQVARSAAPLAARSPCQNRPSIAAGRAHTPPLADLLPPVTRGIQAHAKSHVMRRGWEAHLARVSRGFWTVRLFNRGTTRDQRSHERSLRENLADNSRSERRSLPPMRAGKCPGGFRGLLSPRQKPRGSVTLPARSLQLKDI